MTSQDAELIARYESLFNPNNLERSLAEAVKRLSKENERLRAVLKHYASWKGPLSEQARAALEQTNAEERL